MSEIKKKTALTDVAHYLDGIEKKFPYHNRAIEEEIAFSLKGHYPGEHRYHDSRPEESKKTSTYNITNFQGLHNESEYASDEMLLKLLHAEMSNDPKLMELYEGVLQLTNAGTARLNNVFNEMESHYLLYKPALWKTICYFLRNSSIAQDSEGLNMLHSKKIKIKNKTIEYLGLKLDNNKQIATKQMLLYIKELLLIGDAIQSDHGPKSNRIRNNILGHCLQFFRRRLHMDLSEVYQKRSGLFEYIASDLLNCDERIIYDEKVFDTKRIKNNTEYQDSQFSMETNFTIVYANRKIDCTLYGRTKSAKSINDKLESNYTYDYIDAMDDLFAYTITTENQEDLGIVAGVFMSQFLSKRIGTIENNHEGIKISSKGGLLDDSMREIIMQAIKSSNHGEEKEIIFAKQGIHPGKTAKKITSKDYKDIKAQMSFTSLDGHPCGCEVKFMTNEQFAQSESNDESGNIVMKIKDKLKKDTRYRKILTANHVSTFISKLKKNKKFRGQEINPKKVEGYVKQALYCVSFTIGDQAYIGYVSKDYLDYHRKHNLIGQDVTVIDRVSPQ